jgi:hypothetical protein
MLATNTRPAARNSAGWERPNGPKVMRGRSFQKAGIGATPDFRLILLVILFLRREDVSRDA